MNTIVDDKEQKTNGKEQELLEKINLQKTLQDYIGLIIFYQREKDSKKVSHYSLILSELMLLEKLLEDPIRQKLLEKIELEPNNPENHYNLGEYYDNRGVYGKAIKYFQEAVELEPNNPENHYQLGLSCHNAKKHEKAADCFNKTIQLKPKNALIYTHIGLCYIGMGKYSEAINCINTGLEVEKNAQGYSALGDAYHKMKEYTKALPLFAKAIELKEKAIELNKLYKPDLEYDHYSIGDCHYALKEYQDALDSFLKAKKLMESNHSSQTKINTINHKIANCHHMFGNRREEVMLRRASMYQDREKTLYDKKSSFLSFMEEAIISSQLCDPSAMRKYQFALCLSQNLNDIPNDVKSTAKRRTEGGQAKLAKNRYDYDDRGI